MDKVFLLKDFEKLNDEAKNILLNFFQGVSKVLVKIHFGEPGNKTALFPKDVEPVANLLKTKGIELFFYDTPVAYDSPRNSVSGYKFSAEERGWGSLGKIIIGENFKEIATKDFLGEVGTDLIEAEAVLVFSHVKGHYCSGFGGAVKNLGMGGVSAKTKTIIHNLCKPIFVDECEGCGSCAKLCPAKAIKMVNHKAEINLDSCWGCSICELTCPSLSPKKAIFDDLLAQGASAVINNLPKKTFYLNLIKNITKYCDCEVDSGEILSEDIGLLFSENPIAIDKASLDLINKQNKREIFKEENHKDPLLHIGYASTYIKKNTDYELIII